MQASVSPLAPPAHVPFPAHHASDPFNFRPPVSVQEQLAASQSKVNSLLGTLQHGPPPQQMHLPQPILPPHQPPVLQQVFEFARALNDR